MHGLQAAGDPPLSSAPGETERVPRPGVAPPVRPGRSWPRLALFIGVAAAWAAADQVTKNAVVDHLRSGRRIVLLGGHLLLVQSRNSGAAFGFATGETVVLTVVAVIVVGLILRTARRLGSTAWAVALGLVLGGALGNLGDRIFRSPGVFRGWVVDWIDLRWWPVFNLADAGIVAGVLLVVLLTVRGVRLTGTR